MKLVKKISKFINFLSNPWESSVLVHIFIGKLGSLRMEIFLSWQIGLEETSVVLLLVQSFHWWVLWPLASHLTLLWT